MLVQTVGLFKLGVSQRCVFLLYVKFLDRKDGLIPR